MVAAAAPAGHAPPPVTRWDKHAIKSELGRRGLTLLGVARVAGLEPSATRVALLRRHYAGEAAIAAALGVAPAELWPERYPPSAPSVIPSLPVPRTTRARTQPNDRRRRRSRRNSVGV